MMNRNCFIHLTKKQKEHMLPISRISFRQSMKVEVDMVLHTIIGISLQAVD